MKQRLESKKIKTLPLNLRHIYRLLYQKRLLDKVKHIPGDIVECGVGEGDSFLDWAVTTFFEGPAERHIWGFDSFEGFPEPSKEDLRNQSTTETKKGDAAVPMEVVQNKLAMVGLPKDWLSIRTTLVKGFFENTLHKYTGIKIALLHLDADLYQSYKTVLHEFYPKVVPGGLVVFDEYLGQMEAINWPGAKKAVDEYFADKPVKIERDELYNKYYLIKPLGNL